MPKQSVYDQLTPQKKRFVNEMLIDGIQYKAAIRAGYKATNARSMSSHLMSDPRVVDAIEELRQEAIRETGITPERIIIELGKIAFSDLTNYTFEDENGDTYIDFKKMAKDPARSAITELIVESTTGKVKTKRIRLKMADKISALEKLAKHYGLLRDKVEVTGKLTLEDLVQKSFQTISKEEDNKGEKIMDDDPANTNLDSDLLSTISEND